MHGSLALMGNDDKPEPGRGGASNLTSRAWGIPGQFTALQQQNALFDNAAFLEQCIVLPAQLLS